MRSAVLLSAVRTPIGRHGGELSHVRPDDLAAIAITACAAPTTAARPDAQSRLTVTPATDSGRPARSAPIRATLRLSSPAWLAQPNQTSSISPAGTPARSTAAAIASPARSSGRTSASPPP